MAARLRLAGARGPNRPRPLDPGSLGTNCISDLNSKLIAAASKRVVAVDILVTQPEDRIQWKCGPWRKAGLASVTTPERVREKLRFALLRTDLCLSQFERGLVVVSVW